MNEYEKAVARSCLGQVKVGMTELRQSSAWWRLLSEVQQAEFSEFLCVVWAYSYDLK